MAVIQQDQNRFVLQQQHDPSISNDAKVAETASSAGATAEDLVLSLPSTMQTSPASSSSATCNIPEHQKAMEEPAPTRIVDRNWARVRQKMIGSDSVLQASRVATSSMTDLSNNNKTVNNLSAQETLGLKSHSTFTSQPANLVSEQSKPFQPLEGSGAASTGLRGVLGFRTVVVQRTQLRKMEKDIEKALSRYLNEQSQPRSRSVVRIGTGARGMIQGNTYNLMAVQQEAPTADRMLVDELIDILTRWKSLTVEVPCKSEILKILSKMLLADRAEPLSRGDSASVLNLFDHMRRLFPLRSDPDGLQDLLWCLSILSPKYICKKERIIAVIQELLSPKVLTAALPLSPKNIHSILSTLVILLSEQADLPEGLKDNRLLDFIHEMMDRIRIGDLGVGKTANDRQLQEHHSQVAFLHGLIECLRLRDHGAVHFLLHGLIPKYWIEPVPKYGMTMDGLVRVFGLAASEFVLKAPTTYANGSDRSSSLILDLTLFTQEFLPVAGLAGTVSKEAVAMIIKFILAVFSLEYPDSQELVETATENAGTSNAVQEESPRVSSSSDAEPEPLSRTPPRSPLIPNMSGENLQSTPLPSRSLGLAVDEQLNPVIRHARSYLNTLWQHGFQDVIIEQLTIECENISFARLVNLYHRVVLGSPKSMGSTVLSSTLGTFFSKMVVHQPDRSEGLSNLLLQLSIHHRAVFFKPMIACVASDSTRFVTDYLCVLSCLEAHMGLVDLYMRDAEMICVIAMTDVGAERPRLDTQTQALKWGSCTVGQCVILLEFIYAIKRLARNGDNHETEVGKMFLIDLERKLGQYLGAKERRILAPRPIRVMLCLIFYEIRMLCKTIHRPGWLPRVLDWAINHNFPFEDGAPGGPCGISETMRLRIKHIYSSVDGLTGEHKNRYTIKVNHNTTAAVRRGSTLLPKREITADSSQRRNALPICRGYSQPKRIERMPDIRLDETVAVLMLLITVHSAIHASEYLQLIDPLWNIYCLESRPKLTTSSAFLFAKCADIAPKTIYTLVSQDLASEDPYMRISAVERLHRLFDHRNELLSQPYVIDPSSRGPFRSATIQMPFVISEVGSNRYTMDEPRWLTELKSAGNFPPDIRNRFRELGWGEEDEHETEMTRRAQTPLMLSWTGYLDEDYENKTNFGRTYTVLPKDRHATILIPVLNSLNLGIIDLLNDSAVGVRSAAVNFLSDYMRNEPVLFIRSFFSDIVQARPDRQRDLISRLHMLLSYSSKLPAAFAYALFNHLLGLLKWFQRNSKPQGFEMLTIVLPLLADVVSSTNDIVFKDLKRNKVDVFFAALGRFWFRPHIIPESMFPCRLTSLGHPVGSLGVPQQLFQMTMININQTQFMINFLYRYPLEERDVMASIGRFSRMPKLDAVENEAGQKLGDSQYLPDPASRRSRFTIATSRTDQNLKALSSLRARAWLCFALNLIQRMDKKRAERLQLMSIFNGVNLILLEHSSDLAIVGQALDVYVTAATRLRRFFASQNGYGLLFCALFKTYCDSEWIGVIQDTIDAAFYRFYLLHQEAFVLQSLGAIVPLMLRSISKEKSDIMAKGLFAFLSALDQPTTTCHSKALGIQSLSENFHERSSYGGAQLEIPQWILSLIPRDSKLLQNSNVLQKREFSMADSIKLFLSVIAYDPGSLRSEQFVRVLKQILPLFLDREASLMTSGMDSLIAVFARFSRSSKPLVPPSFVPPPVAPRQIQHSEGDPCDASRFSLFPSPLSKNQAIKGKTWAQNDRVAIKHEFVCLVQLYCERGEQLADVQHQLMATLVRSIVKDYTSLKIPCTTEWIRDYIKCVILPIQNLQQCSRAAIYLIIQFAHALRTHYKVIDFSGFLEGLVLIAEDDRQLLRASVDLSVVIREKITNPALAAVVKGDWAVESVHVSQVKFCSSLVELILAMINNADTDTISELEQTTPSPRFMAHVVVPLCLRFKSRFHANCLDILEMQFWLRILGLTVKAAEFDPASRRSRTAGLFAPVLNAARVTRKRASVDASNPASPQQHQAPISSLLAPPSAGISPQTPLHLRMPSLQINDNDHEVEQQQPRLVSSMNASPGLLVDFIALRIIMVRGERYLSYHPGCWLDIFNIIKKHFSAHAFVTSSLSGPTAFRLNNPSNGSGPSSPNIISTPFPVTPRAEGPVTPRHSVGGFSAFPSFLRSSSDTALLPGSVYTRDNLPATALGYILWSFAETTVFNRLPLMIMMRPFLLDQLRLLDLQPQTSSVRPSRSAGSSGTNSPAFYWPAPSFAPEEHSETSSSPILSPLHLKPDGGVNESTIGQDTASVKRKQRGERRRQWKSWNKPVQPAQTMAAFTPMRDPLHGAGARSQSPQRQWSFMSVSEQNSGGGGGSNNAPRMSVHHTRSRRHQRSDSDVKAEQVLPKILADRANRSMEHVRIMLNSSSDELTASSQFGPPMYSEKRAVSTSLSPSMALHGDRREPSHHIGTENQSSDQFLLPGKYERQPVSPGFGSMFLAREAALKAPRPTPYEGVMQGSSSFIPQHHANRMSLTVPGASMAGKAGPNQYVPHDSIGGRGSADSGNEHPYFVVEDPSHPSPPCQEAERPPLPTIHIEGSTLSTTIAVSLGAPVKKSSSILKPRIITTPSSKTVPVQTLEAAAEVTPTAERSPGPIDHQGTQSELLTDVQKAEETVLGTRVVGGRRPSLSSFDQVDYRMACLQARTKIFLQNIEEETRIVLACFPSVFSIGSVPTSTNPASATSPTTPLTQPADAANATAGAGTGAGTGAGRSGPEEEDNSGQRRGLTRFPEGEELHRTGLAHRNTTSLTVPTRTTPMITIQDQSYLAPSPINPLPSVFDADDKTIFRTSLEQAEEADKVPFLMGSSPTSSTKERRSKSVIFSRKRSVESAADVMSIPSPPSSLLWPVMPSVTSASFSNDPSSQLGSALPAFEITESSPPMPSSPSFIPVYNSTVPTDPSPSHSLYVSSSTSHSALKAVATSTSSAQSSSSTSSSSSLKYPAINVNNADTGKRQDPGVSSLMVPVIIPELLVSAPETMLRHDGDEDKTALIVPTQSRTIGLGVMNPESTRPQ